jgi:ribosome-associated toxin RatA of RatAB toxin-antitoxin module
MGNGMTFEQSILINSTPSQLFAITQDYARRLEWDPFLKSAKLLGGASTAGVGVRAYCVARSGLGMETEYISFQPPWTCAVKMTKGPRLIDRFAGSWRFEEVLPGVTRVGFRYHLRAAVAVLVADASAGLGFCSGHAKTAGSPQGLR